MKKNIFLLALSFLLPQLSHSQNQNNIWHFGFGAGIDFNSGTAVAITGYVSTFEGCSSVSDALGNFLFSTNGVSVYDSAGDTISTMLNGSMSSTQSALIVPFPGNMHKYYIFTTDAEAGIFGLCYSVVNMNLNGGLGGLASINTQLISPSCEKLTGVRNSNGTDYWVITHAYPSNQFYAYPVTAAGVGSPVISTIGAFVSGGGSGAIGYLKCSPDGKKIVSVTDIIASSPIEMFDFNSSTGMLTNYLPIANSYSEYGVAFSPDNSKLYISLGPSGSSAMVDIQQYDLTLTNFQNFPFMVSQGTGGFHYGLQLAPDGKIYCSKMAESTLGVINNPNLGGSACNYEDSAFVLLVPGSATFGLPNLIDSCFSPVSSGLASVLMENNFMLYPNPATDEVMVGFTKPGNAIEITDVIGRIIIKVEIRNSKDKIDIHQLPAGTYTITAHFGDGSMEVRRFVKE